MAELALTTGDVAEHLDRYGSMSAAALTRHLSGTHNRELRGEQLDDPDALRALHAAAHDAPGGL